MGGLCDLYRAGRGPVTCLTYEDVASVYPGHDVELQFEVFNAGGIPRV
jgi:hypothetical protein